MPVRLLRRARDDDRGVALVEFAVMLPLLVVLALGVVEASWALAQQNAVRAMAREGARLAMTQNLTTPQIAPLICDDDDVIDTVQLEASAVNTGSFERGDRAFFEVRAPYTSLTGFIPAFNSIQIVERVEFNSEHRTQPAWWPVSGGGATC
jgi:hypothetical protein